MSDPDEYVLEPTTFDELKGWGDDDPSSLFDAMRACRRHVTGTKPYRAGSLGLTTEDLLPLLEAAATLEPRTPAEARAFFEAHCQPFLIRRSQDRKGFVTAFFEPEIEVSATPDALYRYPFYRRPADLIDLDDRNRPAELDPSYMFARLRDWVIDAYPDRREIAAGYLDGKGLEIAWAKSKVDVFFVHVQGAARLRYPDGSLGRITYAAKAGHPFSAVGRLLIDRGELDRETISMQTIRDWLYDHPEQVDAVLAHNRSYIFFREADVADPQAGPIAAAKVPLVAGRSLAVDRLIHTFGFPFFIRADTLTHLDGGKTFKRLMLALDTGSAIVGPARGDIFTGSGYDAGEQAGTVRHDADFYILLPKAAAGEVPLMAKDRKLSAEERILWSKVAKSTRPLPQHVGQMQALDLFLAEQQLAEEESRIPTAHPPKLSVSQQPLPMPQKPQPSARQHQPLERPVKRKIAKGRLPLEARIDLHGLYQDEAHDMLLDFLVRAHMRGLRNVLVITGKGGSIGSEGALKRAAPLWFSKPEFRYLISSYEAAAQHHGGEGALYIRLARRPGEGP